MRRAFAVLSFAVVACLGLGCQHIAGRSDCSAHPEDAQIYQPTNPYPVVTPK
jgi:hypothetical protein